MVCWFSNFTAEEYMIVDSTKQFLKYERYDNFIYVEGLSEDLMSTLFRQNYAKQYHLYLNPIITKFECEPS